MLPSILRTVVPLLVGYFTALPIARVLGLSDDQVVGLFTALVSAVYWLAVRLLEKVAPQFGWLLGYASQPTYAPPAPVAGKGGDVGQVGVDVLLLVAILVGVILLLFGVHFN